MGWKQHGSQWPGKSGNVNYGIRHLENFNWGHGQYWTHDCLCEQQRHHCTVAVFWQLKLIVINSDITSKILCHMVTDWSHWRGEEDNYFVTESLIDCEYRICQSLKVWQFRCYKCVGSLLYNCIYCCLHYRWHLVNGVVWIVAVKKIHLHF